MNQFINMSDFEKLIFPDLDSKRAFMDKMLADKINEILIRLEDLEVNYNTKWLTRL